MLVLNNGDKLRGGASVAGVVDYTIHGLVGEDLNRFADGQLSDSLTDLYVATATVVVTSFVLVNTDNISRTINLYLQPDGGTSRRIVTKDLSLGVGHSLHYDGVNVNILGPSSGLNISTLVELTDTPNVYDVNKYLRSTVDGTEWATVSGGTGTSIHSELSNLAYDDSGHTGFSPTSHSHTENDISDLDKYTQVEVDTISGTLQTELDSLPTSLIDLSDTPDIYDENKYLRSTIDGTEWTTVSGASSQTFLGLVDTPTTYSGGASQYLKVANGELGIEFSGIIGPENVVYVAKNGNDTTEIGGIDTPFLTIQSAIDYAIATYSPSSEGWTEVRIFPGIYVEQIDSIEGIALHGSDKYSTVIENTGNSVFDAPLKTGGAYYLYDLQVTCSGNNSLLHEISGGSIYAENCQFPIGQFRESLTLSGYFSGQFTNCRFADSVPFNFIGDNADGYTYIELRTCNLQAGQYIFTSKHTNVNRSRVVISENTHAYWASPKVGGDWDFMAQDSIIAAGRYAVEGLLEFSPYTDNPRGVKYEITNCIFYVGIKFLSNMPAGSTVAIQGCSIKFVPPEGEGDITCAEGVIISNVKYFTNIQTAGLDGTIKITNPIKHIGTGLSDSYKNITEAIAASSYGDVVYIGTQTFTENVVLPAGINIKGENYNTSILTSTSGVTLTLENSGTNSISDVTISSTPSGVLGASALQIDGGDNTFSNCIFSSTATETYGSTVNIMGGRMECRSSRFNYTNEVSGGGTHRLFTVSGGAVCLHDSHFTVDIEDAFDDAYVINDHTTGLINITGNHLVLNTVSSGTTALVKQDIDENKNNILYNYVELNGTQGTGVCYIIDADAGEINSTDNSIKITGFDNNYLGDIGNNATLKSHFDNIIAVDGVVGSGTYAFVNSPDPGDIRISGSYINMYDNDIVVAKRGGEFSSLKDAMSSITDSSRTNRYNIHVHSGFYTEDNPIELKPYVYISGAFKHNPRIIPANQLEHLFTVPTGYCTCDLGELTLQAPVGDSGHQVYMVYAGPGCKPIMGLYQCLFLGASQGNGAYCNGVYNSEVLSGYHTVNCMLYGDFNKFSHINGGNWTDSGTLPEFNTALNHYLYMTGEGTALIDLMRNTGSSFENLIYANHADAKIILSDVYSLDKKTLTTGPLGGDISLRGSSLNGKIEIDAGDITIHSGSFENNSYLEALTGNLNSLMITSTRNKNENTYCIKVVGGGGTEIYLGGGNIFDSPNGVQSIQLTGTFSRVQVEGVRQYNIASLLNGEDASLTHLPDLDYSRIIQVQAFPSTPDTADIEYLTFNESNYIQEDHTKTDFIDDKITLSGIGLISYAHWHMNETTGGVVSDSSGFNRDGTGNKIDDADWISGKINNCLQFDAADEYVSFGNIASWERTDSFSIDCWFYTTTDTQMYVLSKMENATGKGYGFYLNARKPYFVLGNNATTNKIEVYSDVAVSSGAWHHGVFTYDGSSTASGITMYIDGANKTLTTVSDALSSTIINTADFQMSGRDGENLIFNYGRVDETALYEKEISSTEVDYRYNSSSGIEDIVCTHNTDKGWYVTTASGSSLDSSTWTNIAQMVFTETIPQYTQIRYLLSTDDKSTWKYWGASVWSTATLSGIDAYGNSSDALEGLNISNWSDLFTTSSGVFDIASSLKTTHSGAAPILDKIEIVYSTPGPRRKIGDSDIEVEYTDEITTKITNNSGDKLTGIKCNILKMQPY